MNNRGTKEVIIPITFDQKKASEAAIDALCKNSVNPHKNNDEENRK